MSGLQITSFIALLTFLLTLIQYWKDLRSACSPKTRVMSSKQRLVTLTVFFSFLIFVLSPIAGWVSEQEATLKDQLEEKRYQEVTNRLDDVKKGQEASRSVIELLQIAQDPSRPFEARRRAIEQSYRPYSDPDFDAARMNEALVREKLLEDLKREEESNRVAKAEALTIPPMDHLDAVVALFHETAKGLATAGKIREINSTFQPYPQSARQLKNEWRTDSWGVRSVKSQLEVEFSGWAVGGSRCKLRLQMLPVGYQPLRFFHYELTASNWLKKEGDLSHFRVDYGKESVDGLVTVKLTDQNLREIKDLISRLLANLEATASMTFEEYQKLDMGGA